MDYLIENAEIIHPGSELNRKRMHILIQNGIISRISHQVIEGISSEELCKINADNLQLSPGWFDMRASFKDPGFEYKETLTSGCRAAMAGGFTEVAILPNTQPVIQSKNEIAYVQRHNLHHLVELHTIAAVSIDTLGKDLTEMIDLHTAGAIAFSDGEKPVWHSDILVKTLMYLQKFDGLLINFPEDKFLTQFGQMNEGMNSTILGLRGMPKLAEEMMIRRDLDFLEYAGGKIHFSMISSAKSVFLIREAKNKGLKVTCDIAAHQLAFDDSALEGFDTNLKVNPPFRSPEDIEALWAGLKDGTIDAIVSDHNPQDEESKNLEFDLAEFGIIGLETAFSVINTFGKDKLSLEQIINKIAIKPRETLKIPVPNIKEGESANLTLFDAHTEWSFTEKDIRSQSKNTPFIGQNFKGKAMAVFHQKRGKILDQRIIEG